MKEFRCPLVGARQRPPAQALLEALPAGAQLGLQPEPENPYDSSAVRVMVGPEEISWSQELEEKLEGYGFTREELEAVELIQLGYLAASGGKPLEKARQAVDGAGLVGNAEVLEATAGQVFEAMLGFSMSGAPEVRITVKEEDSTQD